MWMRKSAVSSSLNLFPESIYVIYVRDRGPAFEDSAEKMNATGGELRSKQCHTSVRLIGGVLNT